MNDNPYLLVHMLVSYFRVSSDVHFCKILPLWSWPQMFLSHPSSGGLSLSQYPQVPSPGHVTIPTPCHLASILVIQYYPNLGGFAQDADFSLAVWCTSQEGTTAGQELFMFRFSVTSTHLYFGSLSSLPFLANHVAIQTPRLRENCVLFFAPFWSWALWDSHCCGAPSLIVFPVRSNCHDWKRGCRIGEATNPGPAETQISCRPLSVGLVNPTTIYTKEDDLLALNNDILCLAETAATKTVQVAFNQALRSTPYRAFWSAPVPDKVTNSDPYLGTTFRGDNLGTAIMTRIPTRATRQAFPPAVRDTCRLNSIIVSTGASDILIVSAYFQTGKSAEARIANNQLLQDILLHTMPIDLPFIIVGDFNTDVRKSDVFPVSDISVVRKNVWVPPYGIWLRASAYLQRSHKI